MPPTVTNDNKRVGFGRVRRTPEASRRAALDAAERLLIDQGPPAVTLKAVAAAVGMSHGNVTHHFGTSAALHAALVARLGERLSADGEAVVRRLRAGTVSAEQVVDLVFDAFETGGYGRMIAWLSATGQQAQLAPIFAALTASVRTFRAGEPDATVPQDRGAGPILLGLVSHALAASLIGGALERAADMPGGSLRRLAAAQLLSLRAVPAGQPNP